MQSRIKIVVWSIIVLLVMPFIHAREKDKLTDRSAPSLSIHEAIRLADAHYQKTEDQNAGRFIERVHYVEYNQSQPEKGPFWVVRYALPRHVVGGQVFLSVYMDGSISIIRGR